MCACFFDSCRTVGCALAGDLLATLCPWQGVCLPLYAQAVGLLATVFMLQPVATSEC